jgi:hypothetical protein
MRAPELLRAEMPLVRFIERLLAAYGYAAGTAEYNHHFENNIKFYRQFGWPEGARK